MRNKLLLALLTVVLVFGLVASASAAGFSDVSDQKSAIYSDVVGGDLVKATQRLSGLGVLEGYADGSFKPDGDITRAEFATVAVRMLGLGSQSQSATVFSDVAASHWASGNIALANQQGIIIGYPDGSFKPEANVTQAEALTMLVRVLGYDPTLTGSWPANVLFKAIELGLTDGVVVNGNAPAKRGDVALFSDNALEVEIWQLRTTDSDGKLVYGKNTGESLLTEKHKVTVLPNTDLDSYVWLVGSGAFANGLDADEILYNTTPDTASATQTKLISKSFDVKDFLGEKVKIYVNNKNKVFFVQGMTSANKIVNDVINEDYGAAAGDKIQIVTGKKEYNVTSNTEFFKNGKHMGNIAAPADVVAGDIAQDAQVKLVLDDNNNVLTVVVNSPATAVVDSVIERKEEIIFKFFGKASLDGKKYNIIKDGKPADLGDLEEDDVVFVYSDSVTAGQSSDDVAGANEYQFIAYSTDTVKGTFEGYYTHNSKPAKYKIVVDGTTYKLNNYVMDKNDALFALKGVGGTNTYFDGLDSQEVELLLDAKGDVVQINDIKAEKTALIQAGVIYDLAHDPIAQRNVVRVRTAEDKKVTYDLADGCVVRDQNELRIATFDDDDNIMTSPVFLLANQMVIKYRVNSDGKISQIDMIFLYDTTAPAEWKDAVWVGGAWSMATGEATGIPVSDKNHLVGNSKITAGTAIFDLSSGTFVASTRNALEEQATINGKVFADDNIAEVVIVTNVTLATDDVNAIVTAKRTSGTDNYVTVLTADGSIEYKYNPAATTGKPAPPLFNAVRTKDAINYNLQGNKISACDRYTAVVDVATGLTDTLVIDSVDKGIDMVEIDGNWYVVGEDTLLVDDTDVATVVDINELYVGQEVKLYVTGTLIEVLRVTK